MSLPLFLRGLLALLVVFAVVTYLITGSIWTTLIDTVICAVLVQAGYFAVVLFMVWRSPRVERAERGAVIRDTAQAAPKSKEEQAAAKVGNLPTRPSSPHP